MSEQNLDSKTDQKESTVSSELKPLLDCVQPYLDELEKNPPIVGITVNPKMWQRLRDLPKSEIKKQHVLSGHPFGSTPIYLKDKQVENYKIFYDKDELRKELEAI